MGIQPMIVCCELWPLRGFPLAHGALLCVRHGMPPDSSKSQVGDDVQGEWLWLSSWIRGRTTAESFSQSFFGTVDMPTFRFSLFWRSSERFLDHFTSLSAYLLSLMQFCPQRLRRPSASQELSNGRVRSRPCVEMQHRRRRGRFWATHCYYLADASETHWGVPPNFETCQNHPKYQGKTPEQCSGPGWLVRGLY